MMLFFNKINNLVKKLSFMFLISLVELLLKLKKLIDYDMI